MLDQKTVQKIVGAVKQTSRLNDQQKTDVLHIILETSWAEELTDAAKPEDAAGMTAARREVIESEAIREAKTRCYCNGSPNKILAIKRVRELTGLSLKDAKDFCDKLWEKLGW